MRIIHSSVHIIYILTFFFEAISFGDLAKLTSKRYKSLSTEERAAWDERSRLDKQRYDVEIKNYRPPAGYDATGKRIEEKKAGPAKKQKVPRDPSQPKRVRLSSSLFSAQI